MRLQNSFLLLLCCIFSLVTSQGKGKGNQNSCKRGNVNVGNGIYPDPTDCGKFILCDNGVANSKSCDSQLWYDDSIKACNWKSAVKCNTGAATTETPSTTLQSTATQKTTSTEESTSSRSKTIPKLTTMPIQTTSSSTANVCRRNNRNRENGLYPHANDCKKFVQCENGKVIKEHTCISVLVYDDKIKTCNWPSAVTCTTGTRTTETPTSSQTTPTKQTTPSPTTEGSLTTQSTTLSQTTTSSQKTSTQSPITPGKNFCGRGTNNVKKDGVYPHQCNCGKYYQCASGGTVEQNCPGGLSFDKEKKICNWSHLVKCKTTCTATTPVTTTTTQRKTTTSSPTQTTTQSTTSTTRTPVTQTTATTGATTSSQPPTTQTQPPKNFCRKGSSNVRKDGVYHHPCDCSRYFQCYSGNTYPGTCQSGLSYDQKINGCNHKDNVKCTTTCPTLKTTTTTTQSTTTTSTQTTTQSTASTKLTPITPTTPTTGPTTPSQPSTTQTQPPKNFCRKGSNNVRKDGLYAHPCDCSRYFQCSSGDTYQRTCQSGLSYDRKINGCNHKKDVECTTTCPTLKTTTTTTQSTTTTSTQTTTQSTASTKPSTTSQSTSTSQRTTSSQTTSNNTNTQNVCRNSTENQYFPHPSNCQKFIVCNKGKPTENTCQKGLSYDVNTRACNWTRLVDCKPGVPRTIPPPTIPQSTNTPLSTISTTTIKTPDLCRLDMDGFFQVPDDCTKFIQCKFGKTYLSKCQDGLHYDIYNRTCDYKNLVNCTQGVLRPFPPAPPTRPTPAPGVYGKALPCDPKQCKLPHCRCSGTETPRNMSNAVTPKIVLLTMDDGITAIRYKVFTELFDNKTNPNGCKIKTTYFVSGDNVDYSLVKALYDRGHEIAVHTLSHKFPIIWWKNATYKELLHEIIGMKKRLESQGIGNIVGYRQPFLQTAGDTLYRVLKDYGFTYDTSLVTNSTNGQIWWPFTFNYKTAPTPCVIPPCPKNSYPGLWEIPIVPLLDVKNNATCTLFDECGKKTITTTEGWYQFFKTNFNRHFAKYRAPFPMFGHAKWMTTDTNSYRKNALKRFLDELYLREDVYLVSMAQAIEYMKKPATLNQLKVQKNGPFSC